MVSQSKEMMDSPMVIGSLSAEWETPSLEDGKVWGRGHGGESFSMVFECVLLSMS